LKKAYGRLDIFWPDGHLETFTLRDAQVTVGRASGNDLVLDTDGVDANHLLLTPDGETVKMISTAHELETFVDGRAVPLGEMAALSNGDEIQLGPLRLVFRGVDDAPTLPLRMRLDDTQRIQTESQSFRVELQLPQISVTPGAYISLELSVTNTGRDAEKYFIEVTGLPSDWLRVNRPALAVEPGESGLVLMNIRPNRHSASQPGDYPVIVTVRPDRSPDAIIRTPLVVKVLPFAGFGIAMSSRRLTGKSGFRLHLHNHGSAAVPVHLVAFDRVQALDVRLSQTSAQLGPGQRLSIAGTVAPKDRRLFGASRDMTFEVVVTSDMLPNFTAAVVGTVVDKPPLPGWAKPALAVGVVLAVLLILFGGVGLFNLRPITPVISAFNIGQGEKEIARGTPLQVQWVVADAERLTLQVGSAAPQDLTDVANGVYEISTDDLSDVITFTLMAYNVDQVVQAERSIRFYRAAVIDDLTVTPGVVFRNVVQNLTIAWTGQGFADGVRLRGLDALGQPVEILSSNEDGRYAFGALPQTNFTIRLLVSDERGSQFERTLDVILADPQCTVNRAETSLLASPNEAAAVREVLNQGVSRIITGRSADAGYLLVRLTDNTEAWARVADFTCPSDQFNMNDLRVIVVQLPTGAAPSPTNEPPLIIVLPTDTPTVTPSPSPTFTPTSTFTPTPTFTPSLTATPTATVTFTPVVMATRTPPATPQG